LAETGRIPRHRAPRVGAAWDDRSTALNTSLFSDVDLTIPLFRDIGWQVVTPPPTLLFRNGFE